jgi:bacterioferritin-associated ferredoxin
MIRIKINVSSRLNFEPNLHMYVCLCKGITDSQIRAAIQDGASSFKDVRNSLGVASQCGKCGILTREILRESLQDSNNEQELFYALS